ncbi:helicase C-terminal domain-containing protein, partial [[Eubacterium] cellulosolvens]
MIKFCPRCGKYMPQSQTICPNCASQPRTRKHPSEISTDDVIENFPSTSLRKNQKRIMSEIVDAFQTGKKCVILAAPTGFGKSYVNTAFASITHSFYATPQLTLMRQILHDPLLQGRFVEIKGRRNYRCYYYPERPVHIGRCETTEYHCTERFDVCPYWKQKKKAIDAQSVLMSLAYLIDEGQTEGPTSLGSRSLLILDESHNLEEECLNHISLRVTPNTIPSNVYEKYLPQLKQIENKDQESEFLNKLGVHLQELLKRADLISKSTGLSIDEAIDKEKIDRYLKNYQFYMSSKKEWISQIQNDQLILQPVYAKEFMREMIWKRADFFIISSATILDPKQYQELTGLNDILDEDQISFLTVESTFPIENRPILDFSVGSLSQKNWDQNNHDALTTIEHILRKEEGNVAIHCGSYKRQQWLVQNISEDLKSRLITHTSFNRNEKLEDWKQSRGSVFVSVAFQEGQDWKYDICDAQILLKVPYPDLGDKRIRSRLENGERRWYTNRAMTEVI